MNEDGTRLTDLNITSANNVVYVVLRLNARKNIDPAQYDEEQKKRKEELDKKVEEYEKAKAELLQRQAEFNAKLDQKYLQISQAAQKDAQYLVMAGSNYPIPLKKIELTGNVVHSVCSFKMIQHYVNIENIPLETVFLFPKTNKTVISKITCDFTLADGKTRTIETKVDERKKAEEKYIDSVSKGQTAVLGTLSSPSGAGMTRV